ncbi:MAG: FHA domain-containing protein [Deltaproteobacteria bacterium]|nr:FHA domain-containing protein [Deltaproteobacteria bacterium]
MAKRVPPAEPPPKTKTQPESLRVPYFDGPDVVTGLRVVGTGIEFTLPREQRSFSLGSFPDNDVALPPGYLSRKHCVLERHSGVLRVIDKGSTNGTIFDIRREETFDLRPGNTFVAGPFEFLAVNDEMRRASPVLAGILGPEGDPSAPSSFEPSNKSETSPSAMMMLATSGRPVLIIAEPGCDQARLARVLHEMSLVRARPPVILGPLPSDRARQREILDAASRSSLLVTIDDDSEVIDAAFASSAFSSSFRIRVIATTPSLERARSVLSAEHVDKMGIVKLPALAFRTTLPALLDHALAERGAMVRFSQLTAGNQSALQGFGWPRNLDDLRFFAERIDLLSRTSLRSAAKTLGYKAHSTLSEWLAKVGLTLPLVADDAAGER